MRYFFILILMTTNLLSAPNYKEVTEEVLTKMISRLEKIGTLITNQNLLTDEEKERQFIVQNFAQYNPKTQTVEAVVGDLESIKQDTLKDGQAIYKNCLGSLENLKINQMKLALSPVLKTDEAIRLFIDLFCCDIPEIYFYSLAYFENTYLYKLNQRAEHLKIAELARAIYTMFVKNIYEVKKKLPATDPLCLFVDQLNQTYEINFIDFGPPNQVPPHLSDKEMCKSYYDDFIPLMTPRFIHHPQGQLEINMGNRMKMFLPSNAKASYNQDYVLITSNTNVSQWHEKIRIQISAFMNEGMFHTAEIFSTQIQKSLKELRKSMESSVNSTDSFIEDLMPKKPVAKSSKSKAQKGKGEMKSKKPNKPRGLNKRPIKKPIDLKPSMPSSPEPSAVAHLQPIAAIISEPQSLQPIAPVVGQNTGEFEILDLEPWKAYEKQYLNPKGKRERAKFIDCTEEHKDALEVFTYRLSDKKQQLLNQILAKQLKPIPTWETAKKLVQKLIGQPGIGGKISYLGNGSATNFKIGHVKFTVHGSHRYGPQMYQDQMNYLANGLLRAGILPKD